MPPRYAWSPIRPVWSHRASKWAWIPSTKSQWRLLSNWRKQGSWRYCIFLVNFGQHELFVDLFGQRLRISLTILVNEKSTPFLRSHIKCWRWSSHRGLVGQQSFLGSFHSCWLLLFCSIENLGPIFWNCVAIPSFSHIYVWWFSLQEVVAVSVGPKDNQQVIVTALAMGADRGIHIETENEVEPLAVAKIFKKLIDTVCWNRNTVWSLRFSLNIWFVSG